MREDRLRWPLARTKGFVLGVIWIVTGLAMLPKALPDHVFFIFSGFDLALGAAHLAGAVVLRRRERSR